MSQTLLHAVCLQAPYAPVPQDSIIQSVCGITEVRAAFTHDIRQGGADGDLYRHRVCRLDAVEGLQTSAHPYPQDIQRHSRTRQMLYGVVLWFQAAPDYQ